MSDNIPFEIQMEIMKWLPVKPLIQFRSVSKSWKSFIDSSEFIKAYGARHTQPHSSILSLSPGLKRKGKHELRYICLVDDDRKTFKVQQQESAPFVMPPLLKRYHALYVIGACHGLMCLYCYKKKNKRMIVIWNPCIGKSFGIAVPTYDRQEARKVVYGFGVCPVTSDPTVLKFAFPDNMPWHVEVFTLSSGVWNVIPSGKLPRQSIELNKSTQVVIDRFIYWAAGEITFADNGERTLNHMVVLFDLEKKEFRVVDLPDTLKNERYANVSVCNLRGSLAVCGNIKVEESLYEENLLSVVWVMEHDSSFRELFSISGSFCKLLGFSKSGEPVLESLLKLFGDLATPDVYNPCSRRTKDLGISGVHGSFFMDFYKESLLLLDHSDLHIYYDDS